MPIQLATPFDPGDTHPGKSYTHVRIMRFAIDLDPAAPAIDVDVRHGYLDSDGGWVSGIAATKNHRFRDRPRSGGQEFSALVAGSIAIDAGERAYDIASASLYAALLDTYPGTIV